MMQEFRFRGRGLEELRKMSLEEFAALLRSRERRTVMRGFTDQEKKFLLKVRKNPDKFHKTHCRDMIIIPEMIGAKIGIFNGKEFVKTEINPEMLGHRLGEFAMTRKATKHSAPGFGATKSSKYIPLK